LSDEWIWSAGSELPSILLLLSGLPLEKGVHTSILVVLSHFHFQINPEFYITSLLYSLDKSFIHQFPSIPISELQTLNGIGLDWSRLAAPNVISVQSVQDLLYHSDPVHSPQSHFHSTLLGSVLMFCVHIHVRVMEALGFYTYAIYAMRTG